MKPVSVDVLFCRTDGAWNDVPNEPRNASQSVVYQRAATLGSVVSMPPLKLS